MDIKYAKIGSNKSNGRIWLEGNNLIKAGFIEGAPYRRVDNIDGRQISLFLTADNPAATDRKVTASKRGGKSRPIIDLCDRTITEIFGDARRVRVTFSNGQIVIEAHHEDINKETRETAFRKRYKAGQLREASLFTGGGISTEAIHSALDEAGLIDGACKWVAEIEPRYIESAQDNCFAVDDTTAILTGPVEEIETEFYSTVDVLSFSMPCAGFSKAGSVKHKQTSEEHSGSTLFATVSAIKASNPAVIISENVVESQSSPMYQLLRGELERLGYTIFESILGPEHTGSVEHRRRYWFVAISSGLAPSSLEVPSVELNSTPLAQFLESVDDSQFCENQYLKDKSVRDSQAGKGFAKRQLLTGDETKVGTIGRHYAKRRSTEPFIVRDDGKERLLTPTEHARVKSIPERLIAGNGMTIAHQILGQSVDFLQPYNLTRALLGAL